MKRFLLILLSAALLLTFAACGKDTNKKVTTAADKKTTTAVDKKTTTAADKKTDTVTVTPAEIEKKIADAVGADNYLCDSEIDKDWLTNSYGLDLSKIESYAAKQSSIPSINLDVVIVLKAKDGYADEAADLLNKSFAQTVDYIRQYPFGTAKVMNGRLYKSGNYVIYVIAGASYDGEDSEAEAKLAVSEYEKIDAAVKGVFGELPKNIAVIPEDDGNSGGLLGNSAN